MANKNVIGQRIRTMRLSRGMTQADLAKAIDQSQSSITMYETGRREPDFETLEALADVFNVPMVSFVDGGGVVAVVHPEEESQSDDFRMFVRDSSQLSPEQFRMARSLLRAAFRATNPELFKGDDDK